MQVKIRSTSVNNSGLTYYQAIATSIEARVKSNGGRANLQQNWRFNYCKKPYLFFATDEEVKQRAYDAANNAHYLGESGKIEARSPIDQQWSRSWQTFQDAIEEMTRRGIHPREILNGKEQFAQYFRDGRPMGPALLEGINFDLFGKLLKFSKREYVQDMLNHGRFRISPAASYDTPAYNVAMADIEIERSYRLSLISEYMNGQEFIEMKGTKVPVSQGYVPVGFPLPNYYLFCTCGAPERRMPTDFEADSALLIHRPEEFVKRMKAALHQVYPTWQFIDQPVKYYDSYKDLPTDRDQEFHKDFKFAYQSEHRIVLRPNGIQHNTTLQPFFVELGNLTDLAEVLVA